MLALTPNSSFLIVSLYGIYRISCMHVRYAITCPYMDNHYYNYRYENISLHGFHSYDQYLLTIYHIRCTLYICFHYTHSVITYQ